MLNSGGAFSPIAYPWVFPLLLSPFVKWWGLDYDRLKLVEVACFCAWIVLVHGIVRRRAGRLLAIAIAAVVATAPALLAHTDQLLSEFPHAMALGVFIWWFDRIKAARRPRSPRPTSQLVTLGVLGAVAYNVRRESVVLIGAIARRPARRAVPGAGGPARSRRVPWLTVATPHLALVGSIVVFQLLLPSMLIPDSGDGPRYIPDRIGDYAGVAHRASSASAGTRRSAPSSCCSPSPASSSAASGGPKLDIPLAAVALFSVATVSTHFRMVDRYYFQVLPWVLYFAAQAIIALFQLARESEVRRVAAGHRRRPAAVPRRRPRRRAARRHRRRPRLRPRRPPADRTDRPGHDPDLRGRREVHRARRRDRLLPGPHDDRCSRTAWRSRRRACRASASGPTTSPSSASRSTSSPPPPRPSWRRPGSSRCGRTSAGSSGGCPTTRRPSAS